MFFENIADNCTLDFRFQPTAARQEKRRMAVRGRMGDGPGADGPSDNTAGHQALPARRWHERTT